MDGYEQRLYEESSVANTYYDLVQGLSPGDAGRAARLLSAALAEEKDARVRRWLIAGLCLMAERMDGTECGEVCGPFAKEMAEAVTVRKEAYRDFVMNGFISVVSHVDSSQAELMVPMLGDAMDRGNAYPRVPLARALAMAASRIDPHRASDACAWLPGPSPPKSREYRTKMNIGKPVRRSSRWRRGCTLLMRSESS